MMSKIKVDEEVNEELVRIYAKRTNTLSEFISCEYHQGH